MAFCFSLLRCGYSRQAKRSITVHSANEWQHPFRSSHEVKVCSVPISRRRKTLLTSTKVPKATFAGVGYWRKTGYSMGGYGKEDLIDGQLL